MVTVKKKITSINIDIFFAVSITHIHTQSIIIPIEYITREKKKIPVFKGNDSVQVIMNKKWLNLVYTF